MVPASDDDGFTLVKAKTRRGRTGHVSSKQISQSKVLEPQKVPEISAVNDVACLSKRKKNNRQQRLRQRTQPEDPDQIVKQQIEAIEAKKQTLRDSDYFSALEKDIVGQIRGFSPLEIVCYGVGSLALQVSQWQLALILLLNEHHLNVSDIMAYDPATTEADALTYERLGVSIIPVNEEAKRKASKRTLFYMPHCEVFLYENLLSANWTAECLLRIMIIGNSLQRYLDSNDAGRFAQQSPHINRVLAHVVSAGFPSEKMLKLRQNPYAFTDTCLQRIEFGSSPTIDLEAIPKSNGPS